MEDLRRYFSSESIEKLNNLNRQLQSADGFSDSERREIFRMLHTLKGSSQTFGFTSASKLAHKLETILSTVQHKENFDETAKKLFVEGIGILILCLQKRRFEIPVEFSRKINAVIPPESPEQKNFTEILPPEIPLAYSSQLSVQEKNALVSALNEDRNFYVLEIGFEPSSFAVAFKDFRGILSESGEIIAALPSRKLNEQGKIGFQIVFVSFLSAEQVKKIAEQTAAEIIFDNSEKSFSNDLRGILQQAAEHGKRLAKELGKEIEFEVSADETKLPSAELKLIFDVLNHLLRNAVDHAIKTSGNVRIDLKNEQDFLRLTISDDGSGIDLEKIKAKAVEKNLISAGKKLNEREMLDLIFLPEFSTASQITEISGRGVGLDAVKAAIENANGQINVKSKKGKGATFEILLPNNEKQNAVKPGF